MALWPILIWASVQTQNSLNYGEARSPWGRTLLHYETCLLLTFLLAPLKGTYSLLPGWLCLDGKKLNFSGITGPWLWTHTISRRPRKLLWSLSQSQGLRRSGGQWSFSSRLFHSGSSESLNPSCGYFSTSGMQNDNRHNEQLEQSPHCFPNLQSESYYGRKGQVEATRTAST